MKQVFEHTFDSTAGDVVLPVGSRILSVKAKYGHIVLYALVDPNEPCNERYRIEMVGTGHIVPHDIDTYTFLDTVMLSGGGFVVHVFYKRQVK